MSDTLMICVSGMRGIVGKDLTPELVARHAAALGAWARPHGQAARWCWGGTRAPAGRCSPGPRRRACMSVGVEVIDLGIVPTPDGPARRRAPPRRRRADPHREPQSDRVERAQVRRARRDLPRRAPRAQRSARSPSGARRGPAGTESASYREDREAIARHLDLVLALPDGGCRRDPGAPLHVALDCVRGAGGAAIPPLLERLGCRVTAHQPRDRRPLSPGARAAPRKPGRALPAGSGEPGPTSAWRWIPTWTGWRWWTSAASRSARTTPWPSRCGRCWDGQVGRGRPSAQSAAEPPVVVANLSTTLVVEDAARDGGARFVRAPVGEANVARTIGTSGR